MGEAFDKLIELREFVPEHLRQYLRKARLFQYDIYPIQSLDGIDVKDKDLMKGLIGNFCLPYPVTAVEDKLGVVIFTSEGKPSLSDLEAEREVIVGLHFKESDMDNYYRENESDKLFMQRHGLPERVYGLPSDGLSCFSLMTGFVKVGWDAGLAKWLYKDTNIDAIGVWSTRKGKLDSSLLETQFREELKGLANRDLSRSAITAYEELLQLSNHEKVILEKRPKLSNKEAKTKYQKTAHRPTYTLLKPHEARKVMRLPEPEPKTEGGRVIIERRAHWRAAHQRELRAEKWGKSRGKVVQVERTWVHEFWNGEQRSEDSKHFYKVILGNTEG
jgi:hypothetical protein